MKDKIIEILIKHEVQIDDSDYHDVAIFSCDYAQIVAEILAALESEPAKELYEKIYIRDEKDLPREGKE